MEAAITLPHLLSNRYSLYRVLGRGAMATVYAARDQGLSTEVAVKVLRPELVSLLGPARFLREIRIAAELEHPNVLPLLDAGEDGAKLYYVMPLLPDGTLRERLDRELQLTLPEAVRIITAVGNALTYAHEHGIIHRDIKPENILMDGEQPLIADFGIARVVGVAGEETVSSSGLAIGTPGYMSPEQTTADKRLDARSDVYSLGCVFYEMLAGERPFTGPTPQAVALRHLYEQPPLLRTIRPELPAWVDEVIGKTLAKVAADRYQSAAEFVEALGSGDRAGDRRTSRATVLVAIVAAALAVLAGVRYVGTHANDASIDPHRMAVMYLTAPNADDRLRRIADGLSEELIDYLGNVPELSVVTANGIKSLPAGVVAADSIAHTLHVGTIVEGSIGKRGDSLRVAVRLLDSKGRRLGGEELSRPWSELPTLTRDLAILVGDVLRSSLGLSIRGQLDRSESRDATAWELVQLARRHHLDGSELAVRGSQDAARKAFYDADSLLTLAATRDRRWALPLIRRGWLTETRALLAELETGSSSEPNRSADSRTPEEWRARGVQTANLALSLPKPSADALVLRGVLQMGLWRRSGDRSADSLYETALSDIRLATAREPRSALAWSRLSQVAELGGDFPQAAVAARRAIEADAFLEEAPEIINRLFFAALNRRDTTEAAKWCATGRDRFAADPRFLDCPLTLLSWYGASRADLGKAWKALEALERADSLGLMRDTWETHRLGIAAIAARAGLPDSARRIMLLAQSPQKASSEPGEADFERAHVLALLGERKAAIDLLKRFLERTPAFRRYVRASPWFESLRGDRDFGRLVDLS